jgi:hypothetical protein
MTGWQTFADVPCPFSIYYAWDAAEPNAVPWIVAEDHGLNAHRAASHWHALVIPEPPPC